VVDTMQQTSIIIEMRCKNVNIINSHTLREIMPNSDKNFEDLITDIALTHLPAAMTAAIDTNID
jgi:hypothetical protein